MLRNKHIPEGRECSHVTCSNVCHREAPIIKWKQPIKRMKPTKVYSAKPKAKDGELEDWFIARGNEMTGKCCNCGGDSSAKSGKYWKWSICHVIPKSDFHSVATHPSNFIELCISCHTLYDRSLAVAHTLKCWPLAVAKFKLFESEITENRKYLDLFKQYAEQI